MNTMTIKMKAVFLVADQLGVAHRDVIRYGLKWVGVHGGDHVVLGPKGKAFGVDLVTEEVGLYVGVYPPVQEWPKGERPCRGRAS